MSSSLATTDSRKLLIGDTSLEPRVTDGWLQSLGSVSVQGTPLRSDATRFLPWFDSFEGDMFRRFRLQGIQTSGNETVIHCRVESDPDVVFRERRDSSGDPCFRDVSWDAPARQGDFRIHLTPANAVVDNRHFTGFRYWFSYQGDTPIHRIIDRQTWELGGKVDGNTLLCRNWLTSPRVRLTTDEAYTTVGLFHFAGLLPGNLWGRWTLLPSFDLHYGPRGVFLAWFDRVSLIRTVIESGKGESSLRHLDLHAFEQATAAATNPKTILYCPDVLDDIDALNLWTALHDQEMTKACRQFSIPEPPAQDIVFTEDKWVNIKWDSTYETLLDGAGDLGADTVFIDPVWENEQTMWDTLTDLIPAEKRAGTIIDDYFHESMCATLDFRVAQRPGGEAGLKALCDRAKAKGLNVISWFATHLSSDSPWVYKAGDKGKGNNGVFAAKESGRHPDTGYASGCWTLNLNTPMLDHVREQLLSICQRTGLSGFLWDSFCNLGWWQVDYSQGTMRPQFDKMAELYAAMSNAGLRIYPEAIVTFSNNSMCGLHGGNVYDGDQLGFSYHTCISLLWGGLQPGEYWEHRILRGQEPIDLLFQCFAHKRIPLMTLHRVPRSEWNPAAADAIRHLFAAYKQVRHLMKHRTVLRHDRGVLWHAGSDEALLFSFKNQPYPGHATSLFAPPHAPSSPTGQLHPNTLYRVHTPEALAYLTKPTAH